MPELKRVEINDEIDVRELFLALWRGKYIILTTIVLAVVISSIHLRNSERKYTVEAIFKPVIEPSGGSNLSGLSGLASLAGVSLPTSSSSDFTTYQRLIFSEEVAARVFVNQKLIVKLFEGEWDPDASSFKAPLSSWVGELKQSVKSALTGFEKLKYVPPNPKRLSMLMESSFGIYSDLNGFLTIKTETTAPEIMLELISNASQETDRLLKERFFLTAEATLEFYYKKMLVSRSPEHREALAKLISAEDQKLMLATKSTNFVAELLTIPNVSLYPTSPRASLVLSLGFVLGIFLGVAIVFVRRAIENPRIS
jgi:uncharacterized protein involved in exopolysaccharide biosynthesis